MVGLESSCLGVEFNHRVISQCDLFAVPVAEIKWNLTFLVVESV